MTEGVQKFQLLRAGEYPEIFEGGVLQIFCMNGKT